MASLVVSAVGADRPGIVAAVTNVLYEHGANVEDASMTILRGQFAMTLVVEGGAATGDLRNALDDVARELGLLLHVGTIAEDEATRPAASPYVVSVYGADRPGIVARVTALLADRGANVTDLATRLHGPPGDETYVMVIEVDVPAAAEAGLARDLAALAADLRVDATLHSAAADLL